MDRKGEGGSGITFEHVIGLLIGVVVLGTMFGCGYKVYSAQECPAGYSLIQTFKDPYILFICGSLDDMEEGNYRCCQRKSNPKEICKYYRADKELSCEILDPINFETMNMELGIKNCEILCTDAQRSKEDGGKRSWFCNTDFYIGEKGSATKYKCHEEGSPIKTECPGVICS